MPRDEGVILSMAKLKCIAAWLMTALLLWCAVPEKCAAAGTPRYGVTYRDRTVNLRQQATQYSTKLGSYSLGDWMSITGESGNWYYVTAPDGKTGYMSKNYVQVLTFTYGAVAEVTNPKANSFLNLRAYPSYSAQVLGIYYNTAPVVLLDYSDGWYHVLVEGKTGYLREEYLTAVGATVAFSDQYATVVTPNNTGLNLRAGPGMGYGSLGMYYGGQYVMVLQKGNNWWRVSVHGQEGFMNSNYLRSGLLSPSEVKKASKNTQPTATPDNRQGYAVVTNPRATQLLNLRESASTTARVIGQFKNGTRLTMLEQGTEWCKIQVTKTGEVGYMMTQYLTLYNLPAIPTKTVTHPQKSFVNLRMMPSQTIGEVLTRLPHGTNVTVMIPGDSWSKVRSNGYVGYVMTLFLK